MKKRFSILLLLLTICFMTSHAQQMPITVTPILTPPYTPSLSKMCESGSTSLMVNVFVNDVTASDIQLRLHLKLESTGITIESVSKAPVRPISVGGGEARVLMGSDLADVLSLNNLTFKGYDKAAYIKTGALPGGVWRLTAWLEHYHTGRILSNKGTAMAVIASYPPPVLTSPKNNEVTTGDMSKPIVFTWNASKFMGGTASLLYTLEMWEMHTDGVPAEAVVASQSPIYTSAPTAGQSHTLIPTSLAMEPGRKYCWRVTVSDPSGKVHIQNSGRSEVRVFQYLEKCPDICELNVTVRDVTATATWDVDTRHKGGWNVEMYDDAGTYHETLWTGNNNTGEQIFDYGTKWHVRVQGVCQGGQVSAWSEWKDFQIAERFTTPKRDDGTPYECGEFAEPRVITNMEEKELKKGDIFENERGTTKYEIYSATKNDDGSYRGLSYIILSIWNCKVLGEYDNLRVNTDGVNISNFSWRSKKSDLLMADPDAIKQWTEDLAKDIAGATYNNTIKETIKLDDVSFETIVHKDGKYYAIVKTETGEIEEVDITYSVDGKKRVAIEDKDGKQLVVDKNGEMMGVEEYKYCGGSKILLNENMKEKDAKMVKSGNVYFSLYGDDYLFDSYEKYKKHSAADGYAKRFPSIGEGNYRPAYACAESKSEIQILAEPYKTYTFKNERGVPVVCKDGILTISARGDRDTTSVYAYDYDGQIVGKVNVLSYDKVTRKVCLVPVGIDKSEIKASEIKQGLDEKFSKLMVDFEVTVAERIDITYAKGDKFVHGGSGVIGVYNDDQKSAISKLKEAIAIDGETCYLFMVKNCIAKKADDSDDVVSGYMPRGYQFGFIYNELTNSRTIAHELSHGAFHLKHTFVADDDYIAPERSTDNLMDYAGGVTLNHWQWQDVHLPKSVRFKWLQDEAGAEAIANNVQIVKISHEDLPQKTGSAAFLTLAGIPLSFNDMAKMQEMYFTGKQIDDNCSIDGQPISIMTADRGLLVAFKYDGVLYTPKTEQNTDVDQRIRIFASDYLFRGYFGDEYYESTPNAASNNNVWWLDNGEWKELLFAYDPNQYVNASEYNKEGYRGANYFATFIERRTSGVSSNGATYVDNLKGLDITDFLDEDIWARYNPWGEKGLLQKIRDQEGEIRLVYTKLNDNHRVNYYEFDYILEDWRVVDVASISELPLTLDLIATLSTHCGHEALDIIGLVPVVGEAADLINATWYLCEGELGDAALSAASMLPIIGDYTAKLTKYTIKVVKADKLLKSIDVSAESLNRFRLAIKDCKGEFFEDFADASDDVLIRFVEKPELVDAWTRLRKIGVNEKIFTDVDALEVWINLESVSVPKVAPSVMQPLKNIGLNDAEIGKLISINRKASVGQATKAEIKLSQEIAEVCFDLPEKGEMITKFVTIDEFYKYNKPGEMLTESSSIGGCIAKKSDYLVENASSQQLIVDFGLHYDGSKFAANKGYVKIETEMTSDMAAAVTQPHLLDDAESILSPPQTLTGSLGHTDVERITPEFHLGLDGTINKRWELEPGKTNAIEYDASGTKLREWEYKETSIKGIFEWEEKPLK